MTALLETQVLELHAVDVDNFKSPFAINEIKKDIARGEVKMLDSGFMKFCNESTQSLDDVLLAFGFAIAELVEIPFKITAESDEVRLAEKNTIAFHESDDFRSAYALAVKGKAIDVASFGLAFAEKRVDDTFQETWFAELLDTEADAVDLANFNLIAVLVDRSSPMAEILLNVFSPISQ